MENRRRDFSHSARFLELSRVLVRRSDESRTTPTRPICPLPLEPSAATIESHC